MSENIREGLDKEALAGLHQVIPAFKMDRGGRSTGSIAAYLTSREINIMPGAILSHLKSQIEQMENPSRDIYPVDKEPANLGARIRAYEQCRQDILNKL